MRVLSSENGDNAFQKKFIRYGMEGSNGFINAIGGKPEDKKAHNYRFVFLIDERSEIATVLARA
ncbi:MAG: hypothetical protein LBK61_07415 [Spirochaetaceae bacterium]|jgi:hypothetical protein|nr:hypothetical protein [Spirochaetaceae bacterium]